MVLFLYAQTSTEQAAGLAAESPHLKERVSATRKCEQGGVSRAAVLAEEVVCAERLRIESCRLAKNTMRCMVFFLCAFSISACFLILRQNIVQEFNQAGFNLVAQSQLVMNFVTVAAVGFYGNFMAAVG